MHHHTVLEINLSIIQNNYDIIKKYIGDTCLGLAIKGNAYGTGAQQIFDTLYTHGCRDFYFAYAEEAVDILNTKDCNIYILNDFNVHNADLFFQHKFIPVIHSIQQLALIKNTPMPCVIHVDTGMNRTGLLPKEFERADLRGLDIVYIMSHFSSSDDPSDPVTEQQYELFMRLTKPYPHIPKSLANSRGIFLDARYHLDQVRPGIGVYGFDGCYGHGIENCAHLWAKVIQVKDIDAGESLGYNHLYTTQQPTRVATLGCGYHDGIPIGASNKGYVLFGKHKAPIIGRISMDATTVDISHIPEPLPNRALVFGGDLSSAIWSSWSEQNIYQHVMKAGSRVARVYVIA